MTIIVIAISLLAVFAVGFAVGLSTGATVERKMITRYYISKFSDSTSRSLRSFVAQVILLRHYTHHLEGR